METGVVRRVVGKRDAATGAPVAPMTASDLRANLASIFGDHGWQVAFCRGTGLSTSTMQRYLTEVYPIPRYIEVIVSMLATIRNHELPVPEQFSVAMIDGGGLKRSTASAKPSQADPGPKQPPPVRKAPRRHPKPASVGRGKRTTKATRSSTKTY